MYNEEMIGGKMRLGTKIGIGLLIVFIILALVLVVFIISTISNSPNRISIGGESLDEDEDYNLFDEEGYGLYSEYTY